MVRETEHIYQDLLQRISSVRKRRNAVDALRGVLMTTLLALPGALVALLAEQLLRPGVVVRSILFWLVALLVTASFLWFVGRPILRLLGLLPDQSDDGLARMIGKRFPTLGDRLANVLQLFPERDDSRYYSGELIDASFEDIRRDTERLDFLASVDPSSWRRLGRWVLVACTAAVLCFIVFPAAFQGAAHRLWYHGEVFAEPAPFRLFVEPGNREVVKGEEVRVVVRAEGAPLRSVTLRSKQEGESVWEEWDLSLTKEGVFNFVFPPLKATTLYYATASDISSDEYRLTVTDRPSVRTLQVRLEYPRYAGMQPRQLDDNAGDVTALKGTRILFSIVATKPLADAMLVFNEGVPLQLAVDGGHASGKMVLMKDCTYHIQLTDREGTPNAEPIEYTMRVVPDAYPAVTIVAPGMNLDVTDKSSVNLVFRISDDFGFTKLRLAFKLIQSRYEKPAAEFTTIAVPLPAGIGTEGLVPFVWSLAGLSLVPEDVVSYHAEVFDNDDVSGPKSAVSESYTLRLPSMDEVFSEVDKGHEISLESMKEALDNAQEARKELEELNQDMKQDRPKTDWQDQKKAEDLLQKYGEIQHQMGEVGKKIDQMVSDMQKNQVLSPETLEKYMELQHMMEELNSPEFAEAMKKLQMAMQQMSPEQMREALKQFTFSEENFRKSIERTLNLLKRIQIEQKVDEMVHRLTDLQQKQGELKKATESVKPGDQPQQQKLAEEQRDLKAEVDRLRQELEELQKKMENFPGEMPLTEMEKTQASLDQSKLADQMEEIGQQILQSQISQAMQGQQSSLQKIGDVLQQMQQAKKALQQNQQKQIVNQMRKAFDDLLELSKRQEALKNDTQGLEQNSQRFRENAQQQMELLRDLGNITESLSAVSQKSFAVTPEMGKQIGDAMRQMNDAMKSLDERNGRSASDQQGGAMASLNEAARAVESAVNGMMKGGGQGIGMAGFMQRLQQMAQRQQGINQGTEQLGGMSQEQAAAMARLAGEQGMVRKSLEQLTREAAASGDLGRILGDLRKIAEEMREVQTDLAQGTVNPETRQRQERILSRLLDSQRSVRERDFEKTRRSESGKHVAGSSPPAIDLTTQEGKNRLRKDLLKALEEGYARDYQELIRKYFEALQQ